MPCEQECFFASPAACSCPSLRCPSWTRKRGRWSTHTPRWWLLPQFRPRKACTPNATCANVWCVLKSAHNTHISISYLINLWIHLRLWVPRNNLTFRARRKALHAAKSSNLWNSTRANKSGTCANGGAWVANSKCGWPTECCKKNCHNI